MASTNVVLGVSGSIAAFKAAALASAMVKQDITVRVALTSGGARFVSPLTFEALTGNPAGVDIWDEVPAASMEVGQAPSRMGHLDLARWADVLVVAPATADTLARLALGLADDLLSTVALACQAPLVLAPAMESGMWQHPATRRHLTVLKDRGATVVGPATGRLASGSEGEGRMAEPDEILEVVQSILYRRHDLAGLRVLVTAGPTYEAIDPVRFIGNHSSGKMGFAIAEEARDRGASVTLISGPVSLPSPYAVETIHIQTANELRQQVVRLAPESDVVVMAAAVADFRPAAMTEQKIKRGEGMVLELVPTEDIAAKAASVAPRAVHVGFALESDNLLDSARGKLKRKGQDLVVANALSESHNPFGSDRNRVAFVTEAGATELPEMPKRQVAAHMWDEVATIMQQRKGSAGD